MSYKPQFVVITQPTTYTCFWIAVEKEVYSEQPDSAAVAPGGPGGATPTSASGTAAATPRDHNSSAQARGRDEEV